jgi:hypothetical protein
MNLPTLLSNCAKVPAGILQLSSYKHRRLTPGTAQSLVYPQHLIPVELVLKDPLSGRWLKQGCGGLAGKIGAQRPYYPESEAKSLTPARGCKTYDKNWEG